MKNIDDTLKDDRYEGLADGEAAEECPIAFDFKVGENYDYTRYGFLQTLWHFIFMSFARAVMFVFNRVVFGLKIEGGEHLYELENIGAVVVSNHVNALDCTFIAGALPYRRLYFATLERNFGIPIARHIELWLGGVPIPTSPHRLREFEDAMTGAVNRGDFLCIYPEGLLCPYYKRGVRRFRNGAFTIAAKAKCPVLPVAISFRQPRGIYKLYKSKPCVTVNVLSPVYAPDEMNPREATDYLKNTSRDMMNRSVLGE